MTQAKAKLDRKAGLTVAQTIWYTKYALTDGKVTEATLLDTMCSVDYGTQTNSKTIRISIEGRMPLAFGNEWYVTKEAADKQVLTMCANKRKSLQKQLDKIAAIEASIKGV